MAGKPGINSKYEKIDLEQVKRLAGLGFIDREISFILGIAERTLNNWKEKPEFKEALQSGKALADEKVLQALYHRATGKVVEEEKIVNLGGGKQGILKIKSYYPPDVTAMIFWIKNRRQDFRESRDSGNQVDLSELARAMDDQDRPDEKPGQKKAEKKKKK